MQRLSDPWLSQTRWFELGSTIIVLTPKELELLVEPGMTMRQGQPLLRLPAEPRAR
jgi:hypothetical protein